MTNKLVFYFIFLVLQFYTTFLFAQQKPDFANAPANGKITGKIIDANDTKPIEYATISLLNGQDSSLVSGALADEKGAFVIDQLKFGKYLIKASFIGYNNIFSNPIVIRPGNEEVNVGNIALSASAQALKEVEIQGEKSSIEHTIDKTVFNVGSNSIVTGGSATDVLRQVPTVNVDQDGNINVRGSGNITVWINGKPSGITGANRQAVLDQIPANTIEKVELITNPSARYDAEGMGGILNIILKKNRQDGINGSVQIGTGTRLSSHFPIENYFALNKYNAGFSLNVKTGKWNISSNYGYRYNEGWHSIKSIRLNKFTNDTFNLDQLTTGNHLIRQSHSGSINADYNINDKNTLGFGALVGYNTGNNPETIETKNAPKDYETLNLQPFRVSQRDFSSIGNGYNFDGNAYYRKLMAKKGQELNISASFSHGKNSNTNNFDEYTTFPSPRGLSRFSRIINQNFNNVGVAQLDYLNPISDKTKFETGAKATFRNVGTNLQGDSTQANLIDYNRTNEFIFNENIYAAYGLVNHNFGSITIQAGLRAEYTHISGESIANKLDVKQNKPNYQDYINLFPSAHIAKKFANEQDIRLSYSQRVNRPGNEVLNPFPTWNNPLDLRYGNPKIQPEFVHAMEFSYSKNWKDHGIIATTYYRRTENSIQRVRVLENGNPVSRIEFSNISYLQNYGIEIVVRNTFFKIWSITSNFNSFGNDLFNSQNNTRNNSITADIRQMHSIRIMKGFDIQISVFYMLPRATLQGTFQGFNGVDIGVRKDVLKGKGTLNLAVNDIFDTKQIDVKFDNSINTNFEGSFLRKGESRIINLNFTYKFGKEFNIKRGKKAEYNTGGGEGGF